MGLGVSGGGWGFDGDVYGEGGVVGYVFDCDGVVVFFDDGFYDCEVEFGVVGLLCLRVVFVCELGE